MEKKKYVAMIMNRIYAKDGYYIYVASHPTIGYKDEKNKIFIDQNDKEYLSITDRNLMISEINEAYYGDISLDELMDQQHGNTSRRIAISNYYADVEQYVYFVSAMSILGGNIAFVYPISLDNMRKGFEDAYNKAQNRIEEEESKEEFDSDEASYYYSEEYDEEDDNSNDSNDIDLKNMFDKVVTQIMMDIVNDKYTREELKNIKYYFTDLQEQTNSLIESIDIQLDEDRNDKDYINNRVIQLPSKYINIKELYENIKKTLIAQDEPLKRVITEIVRKEQNNDGKSRGILVTGSTGVGKTKMMSLIAKYLDRPFYKIDSTRLTVPGYVGDDIEEHLWNLYVQCGKNKEEAEKAIIFFDEIDKKGSSKKDDISGRGVLNSLLPFVEGSKYNATEDTRKQGETVTIDTSNMTVIFGGAFTDVYKNLDKNHEIGFDRDVSDNNKPKPAKLDDFIEKAKMPDEFMGRVSIVKLNDLDVEGIKKILMSSDESAIKIQQELFQKLGVKLTPGDDYIEQIAKQAIERKTGARGLNTVVDDTTWEAYADAYSNLGKYKEIILCKETVDDPKQYKKIYRKSEQKESL